MKTCPVCDTDYPDHHTACPTDGAVLIGSRELETGSLVRGKYRIVDRIGQGGMGVVYKADDLLLGVPVALKFLAGHLGKDPRFIKRFRTEARSAYQLRHPNIVEVTGLDQDDDGSLFIAMECVEGPSLRAELDEAPSGFAVRRALEIARDIASGLTVAHLQGIVHRDIKPENVLLARTADGKERPKIVDFGIVAVTESVTRMSQTRGLMLTPEYAAPEQWTEMPASEIDGRTDLYALGCLLYEMLVGKTPFHAHNLPEWMERHLNERPRPPSLLRSELTAWKGLDSLVMRLVAKDRDQRPKDGNELVRAIDVILASAPVVPVIDVSTFIEFGHSPTVLIDSLVGPRRTSLGGFETYSQQEKAPASRGWIILLLLFAIAILAGGMHFVWKRLDASPTITESPSPGPGTQTVTRPPVPLADRRPSATSATGTQPVNPPPLSAGTIRVTCDHPCEWYIDGKLQGRLLPGRVAEAKFSAGEYILSAKPLDAGFSDDLHQPAHIALHAAEVYRGDFQFVKDEKVDRGAIDKLFAKCLSVQNEGDNAGALAACNQAVNLDIHGLYPRTQEVRDKRDAIQEECRVNHDPCVVAK